jgi:signal transduction histidine kinase
VESHGGRIWVQSPGEGQGSSFHFALPIRPPATVVRVDEGGAAHAVPSKV